MGLIARAIEEQGIPTISVVMNRDITVNVRTPRALFVHFPYGAPLGPAQQGEVHMAVVRAALDVLAQATEPGTIIESAVEWPD